MLDLTVHVPVLLQDVLFWSGLVELRESEELTARSYDSGVHPEALSKTLVDGTLGGGGHALKLVERLSKSDCFIGMDRDIGAIERFRDHLVQEVGYRPKSQSNSPRMSILELEHDARCSFVLCASSYCYLPEALSELNIDGVDLILLDLGLSSDQLQDPERGFSFRVGGPLDLRFDITDGQSASDLVNSLGEEDLANIIYQYGEERFSRRIARAIVEKRQVSRIERSEQLAEIIHRAVPGRVHGRIDSATRTFQALRIAVNEELEHVQTAMRRLPQCLKVGGRLEVVSFHSLEDRIVKHAMRESSRLEIITKKPIVPTDIEVNSNPRSRSAKLRVAKSTEPFGS